jgi:hypothetical protein
MKQRKNKISARRAAIATATDTTATDTTAIRAAIDATRTAITVATNAPATIAAARVAIAALPDTQDKFPIQESAPFNFTTNVRHPEYENIIKRINTFVNWPTKCVAPPSELAGCGFFYVGVSDMVRCFHCGIGLRCWLENDNPLDEHYKHVPDCSFINKLFGYRQYNIDNYPFAVRHKEYHTLDVRISSFVEWEKSSQQALKLAKAGLFYTRNNICRCFVCGGDLPDCDKIDQPWVDKHKKFPNCGLVPYLKSLGIEKQTDPSKKLLEIGYSPEQIKWATDKVKSNVGDHNIVFTDTMLLAALESEKKIDPVEENRQLKKILKCTKCTKNDVNILYMPCKHHRFCETCAEKEIYCGICTIKINGKIKTYMS